MGMNKLPSKRAQILNLLCEGIAIRAVTRLTGASKNTVAKLLVDAGKVCLAIHDEHVRDVKAAQVQGDEIWIVHLCQAEERRDRQGGPGGAGDTWTWTAIDADTKLIMSWLVGGRDAECASSSWTIWRAARQPRAAHQRRPQRLSGRGRGRVRR